MALLLCLKNTLAMNKFLTALFLLVICPWFLTIQLLLKIWISFFWEKKKKKNVLSNPACSTCKVSNAFPTADTPAGTSWPIIWDFPPSQSYLSHSREQFGVPGQPSLQFAPCHATGMLQCSLCTLLCPQKETLLTTLKFYTRFSRAFHFPFLHHYTT